jgi:hypothetical protein
VDHPPWQILVTCHGDYGLMILILASPSFAAVQQVPRQVEAVAVHR